MTLKDTLDAVDDALRFIDLSLDRRSLDLTSYEASDEDLDRLLRILRYRVRILQNTLREVQQKGASHGTKE